MWILFDQEDLKWSGKGLPLTTTDNSRMAIFKGKLIRAKDAEHLLS